MYQQDVQCCVLIEAVVADHMLPFSDIAGEEPTLETMIKLVVVEKRRPLLCELWEKNKASRRK